MQGVACGSVQNFFYEKLGQGVAFASSLKERIPVGPKTIERIQACFQQFANLDDKLGDLKPAAMAIIAGLKERIPEETVKKIHYFADYVGIVAYLSKVNSLFSGGLSSKFGKKPIKFTATLCTLFSKTSKYLWVIPPLLSTKPWILTAAAVAKAVNGLLSALGIGLSSISIAAEADKPLVFTSYVAMAMLATVAYVVAAPILMSAPPLYSTVCLTANVLSGGLFLYDLLTFGAGIVSSIAEGVASIAQEIIFPKIDLDF